MCKIKVYLLLLFLLVTDGIPYNGLHVEDRIYWYSDAQMRIHSLIETERMMRGIAKNVILFVGDGMGVTSVTAGRILKGQKLGNTGEEYQLAFEKFPHVALSKTYTLDSQIGDSSACATALMCGVKAKIHTVGLDHRGVMEDCQSENDSKVSSLIDWAQKFGKSTGIVTNTRLTHGTPAALYAHSASRRWEDDSRMNTTDKLFCKDITRQLVENEPGRNVNVLLGGGRRHWISNTESDKETRERGKRQDGRNLIDDWLHDKKERELNAEYVWNKAQFNDVDARKTDYLLGIFGYSHLDFEVDRNRSRYGKPSLAEMTKKAIQILKKNPHGFFLMVESGRMDHAHHYNLAARALEEVITLEECVSVALKMVDLTDTLMVVTSDHSHVMTFGGVDTPRGNPILGHDTKVSDVDSKPYTTILYGNGPGVVYARTNAERNISHPDTDDINYRQLSAVARGYSTHGGEDVPVYATGPGSYLFSGTVEQTYIPHAIAYAACIGSDNSHCEQPMHRDDASAPDVVHPIYSSPKETQQPPAAAPVEEMKSSTHHWGWPSSSGVSSCFCILLLLFPIIII